MLEEGKGVLFYVFTGKNLYEAPLYLLICSKNVSSTRNF